LVKPVTATRSIRSASGGATRARIIQAALETLRNEGFAGTSARAIARTGKFNQALIYYHFGSIEGLFIAALQDFSERRLVRYREALEGINSLSGLVDAMTELYEEDARGGEVAAVQEIVAGSSSSADLGRQVVELLDPWGAFAEKVVARLLQGTPLESVLPAKEVAYALVALYFGVETLGHLDPERAKTQALFDAGSRLAPLFDMLLKSGIAGT
jgi:AcrR family transcriptional regulator